MKALREAVPPAASAEAEPPVALFKRSLRAWQAEYRRAVRPVPPAPPGQTTKPGPPEGSSA